MNQSIAFVGFFAFIITVLAIEVRERREVTYAVWLPMFWMAICSSRSIGQWLNLSASDYLEYRSSGSILDQIFLSICIIWGIKIISARENAAIGIIRHNKALIILCIYLGCSVMWSDTSATSFRSWIKFMGNLVMAGVMVTEPEPMESIKSLFRRVAYVLIPLSVMLIKYFPEIGLFYTKQGTTIWCGVAVMKNGLAHLSCVMAFYFIWDMVNAWDRKAKISITRYLFDTIILIMAIWLLLAPGHSVGAASKGCFIMGIAMLIISRMPIIKTSFGRIKLLVILATCMFIVLEYSFGIIELVVTGLGRDMTFTDRIPVWNILIELGLRKLFFGYGYEGFWIGDRSSIDGLSQAHNGYLELFIQGGLVAIAILAILLISILNKIQRNVVINYNYALFQLTMLAIILLSNITESSFAAPRDFLTFVFFIIATYDTALRENTQSLHFPLFRH